MRQVYVVLLVSSLFIGASSIGASGINLSLDVQEVYILEYKDYWDGALETNPFGLELWVNGNNITSVSVTDPHSGNHTLSDWGDGQWGMVDDGFASLAALDAVYGNGNYAFSFNSGGLDADTVTINYQYTQPTGFANVIYPTEGQTGVELNPIYAWGSVDGYGDALGMWVVEESTDDEIYDNTPEYDMTRTSWQPGILDELTEYSLEISVFKAQGGAAQTLQTDGFDEFDYYGLFEYVNGVDFTTVPEPATAMTLLAMAGITVLARGWKKE